MIEFGQLCCVLIGWNIWAEWISTNESVSPFLSPYNSWEVRHVSQKFFTYLCHFCQQIVIVFSGGFSKNIFQLLIFFLFFFNKMLSFHVLWIWNVFWQRLVYRHKNENLIKNKKIVSLLVLSYIIWGQLVRRERLTKCPVIFNYVSLLCCKSRPVCLSPFPAINPSLKLDSKRPPTNLSNFTFQVQINLSGVDYCPLDTDKIYRSYILHWNKSLTFSKKETKLSENIFI